MQIYTQTRNDEPRSLKALTAGRVVYSWRRKGQKGLYGHFRAGIAGQQSSPTVSCASQSTQRTGGTPSPSSPSVASRRPNPNCYTSLLGSAHSRSGRGGGQVVERRRSTHEEEKRECSVSAFLHAPPASPPSFPSSWRRKVLGTLGEGHVPSCPRRGPAPSCASCHRRRRRPPRHSRQRPPLSSALAPDRNR